jgi:type III restriction enzyme
MVVLKTKGDQLDNLDTAYKRELLSVMSDAFAWDSSGSVEPHQGQR